LAVLSEAFAFTAEPGGEGESSELPLKGQGMLKSIDCKYCLRREGLEIWEAGAFGVNEAA
jgi:hypothetical protein